MSAAKILLLMTLLKTKGSEWYSTFKLFFIIIFWYLFENRSVQTADLNSGFCFYRTDMKYQECCVATAERFQKMPTSSISALSAI